MGSHIGRRRRWGMIAVLAGLPAALAWRFAHEYRARAGTPDPHPPTILPDACGLAFNEQPVATHDGLQLPAWFIPAPGGRPGPGVLLVHGWESSRDRTLPNAQVLHAAGFHVLTIDIRGHGANRREDLPISAGEFGADASAGFSALLARPEVTRGAILGHSMGSIGALLTAAGDPRVAGVVATATPAGPFRLTRRTFQLARLPIPGPIAWPLAWLTTRVYLGPRGHAPASISSESALRRYRGPVLLVHGAADRVVPLAHHARLLAAARRIPGRTVRQLVLPEGQHSWLYEDPAYRRTVADFLARVLEGPFSPAEAGARAEATPAVRIEGGEHRFAAITGEPGGLRSMASVVTGAPVRGEMAARSGPRHHQGRHDHERP